MDFRSFHALTAASLLAASPAAFTAASEGGGGASQPTTTLVQAPGPFEVPGELAAFARKATHQSTGVQGKLQALLRAFFARPEDGGLGLTYDGTQTRTLKEIWRDRKANCIGLTALCVQACRILGIEARYAEPMNQGRWVRHNGIIKLERHLVATALLPPQDDLVLDFSPRARNARGNYLLQYLDEPRVKSLWASNRAVETLEAGDMAEAERLARMSVQMDPTCSVAWNTLGVVHLAKGALRESEDAYLKALSTEPGNTTVLGNLETLMRNQGRTAEAAAYRKSSLDLRRRDPYYLAFLAEEALAEHRAEEALNHVRAAIQVQPRDPDLHLLEAGCRVVLGRLDEAEKAVELGRKWSDPTLRERFDHKLAAIRKLGE